jgi:citrate synthase
VAFCASAGTGNAAGVASGLLGMEGLMFGGDCVAESFRFIRDLMAAEANGLSIESQIEKAKERNQKIPGFGRPIVKGDERLKPILKVASEVGLADGSFLLFGRKVEGILDKEFGIRFNVAALIACLLGDMGYSLSEVRAFGTFFPMISFLGVFHEHARLDANPVFPLAISDVEYIGEQAP